MDFFNLFTVVLTLFCLPWSANADPSIRLGGDVIDGKISAARFYDKTNGAYLVVLVDGAAIAASEPASPQCDYFYADNAESVTLLDDGGDIAVTANDAEAISGLFVGGGLGCGDNQIVDAGDSRFIIAEYKASLSDFTLTSDLLVTFTLDSSWVEGTVDSPSTTFTIEHGFGVFYGSIMENTQACNVYWQEGEGGGDEVQDISVFVFGGIDVIVESKAFGLFKSKSTVASLLSSDDETWSEFVFEDRDVDMSPIAVTHADPDFYYDEDSALYTLPLVADAPPVMIGFGVGGAAFFTVVDSFANDGGDSHNTITHRPFVTPADEAHSMWYVDVEKDVLTGSGDTAGLFDSASGTVGQVVVAVEQDDGCFVGGGTNMVGRITEKNPLTINADMTPEACPYDVYAFDATLIGENVGAFDAGLALEVTITDLATELPPYAVVYVETDVAGCNVLAFVDTDVPLAAKSGDTVFDIMYTSNCDGDIVENTAAEAIYLLDVTKMSHAAKLNIRGHGTDFVNKATTDLESLRMELSSSRAFISNPLLADGQCEGPGFFKPTCQYQVATTENENLQGIRTEPVSDNNHIEVSVSFDYQYGLTSYYRYADYDTQRSADVSITTTDSTPSSADWDSVIAPNRVSGWVPYASTGLSLPNNNYDAIPGDFILFVGSATCAIIRDTDVEGSGGNVYTELDPTTPFSLSDDPFFLGVLGDGVATWDDEDLGDDVVTDDQVTFLASSISNLSEGDLVTPQNLYHDTCAWVGGQGIARVRTITNTAETKSVELKGPIVTTATCPKDGTDPTYLKQVKSTSVTITDADSYTGPADANPPFISLSSAYQIFPGEIVWMDCDDGSYESAIGLADRPTLMDDAADGTQIVVALGGLGDSCDDGADLEVDIIHVSFTDHVATYFKSDSRFWVDATIDLTISFPADELVGVDHDVTCEYPFAGNLPSDTSLIQQLHLQFLNYDDGGLTLYHPLIWNTYAEMAITETKFRAGGMLAVIDNQGGDGYYNWANQDVCTEVLEKLKSSPSDSQFSALVDDGVSVVCDASEGGVKFTPADGYTDLDDHSVHSIALYFSAEVALSDFDINEVLTISVPSIDLTNAMVGLDDLPSGASLSVDGQLLLYHDGLLDHPEDVVLQGDDDFFILWNHGAHLNDIAYSYLFCTPAEPWNGMLSFPHSEPSIVLNADFAADNMFTFMGELSVDPGDYCQLVTADVKGNTISSIIEANTVVVALPPEKVLHVTLDSDDIDEWFEGPVVAVDQNTNTVTMDSVEVPVGVGQFVSLAFTDSYGATYAKVSDVSEDFLTLTLDIDNSVTGWTSTGAAAVLFIFRGTSDAVVAEAPTYSPFSQYSDRWFSVADVTAGEDDMTPLVMDSYYDAFDDYDQAAGLFAYHHQEPFDYARPEGMGGTNVGVAPRLSGLVYGRVYRITSVGVAADYTDGETDPYSEVFTSNGDPVPVELYSFTYSHVFSPPAPAGIPYTEAAGSTALTLHWRPPPGNGGFPITRYDVECSTSEAGTKDWDDWGSLDDNASGSTTATDALGNVIPRITFTDLESSTKYTCRVISHTAYGSSVGYANGFQPNMRMVPHSSLVGYEGPHFKVTDDLLDGLWLEDNDLLGETAYTDSGVVVPVEFGGVYRFYIPMRWTGEAMAFNTFDTDFSEEALRELFPECNIHSSDAACGNKYLKTTTHIFTTASSESHASGAHPVTDLDVDAVHDGDGYKFTVTWSNPQPDSATGKEALSRYYLRLIYSNDDDPSKYASSVDTVFPLDASDTEFVLCESGVDDDSCDFLLGDSPSFIDGMYVGFSIVAVSKAFVRSQIAEKMVYLLGPADDDTNRIFSCPPTAPPSSSHYEWWNTWSIGAHPEDWNPDKYQTVYDTDGANIKYVNDFSETLGIAGTSGEAGNSEPLKHVFDLSAPFWYDTDLETGVAGEIRPDNFDASGAVTEWQVWDVNRDAARIQFVLPCAYTSTGSEPLTKMEIHIDGTTEADEFNSDFLDLVFDWGEEGFDGFDKTEEERIFYFSPAGLEPDGTTYTNAKIVLYTDTIEEGLEVQADGLDVGPTLSWTDMRPLMMMPPAVEAKSISSVEITWSPPASDGGSPVRYYEIGWRSDWSSHSLVTFEDGTTHFTVDSSTEAEDFKYTFTGLVSGVNYHFLVRACNRQVFAIEDADNDIYPKCSIWSYEGHGTTLFSSGVTAPTAVSTEVTNTAAVLHVTISDEDGSKPTGGSVRCLRDDIDGGSSNKFSVNDQSVGVTENIGVYDATTGRYVFDDNETDFYVELANLDAETKYSCSLQTWNYNGNTEVTDFTFTTDADDDAAPLAPSAVYDVSFDSDAGTGSGTYITPAGLLTSCTASITEAESDGTCDSLSAVSSTSAGTRFTYAAEDVGNNAETAVAIGSNDLMTVVDTEDEADTRNKGFCFYVMCTNDNDDGPVSAGVFFETGYAAPENDIETEVLDVNDQAVLFSFTAPSSTNGADVTQFHVYCEQDDDDTESVSRTFTVDTDIHAGQDDTYVLQAHLTGLSPDTDYTCYTSSNNGLWSVDENTGLADLPSGTPDVSFTTAGADVAFPLQSRTPWLAGEGVEAEYSVSGTLTREAVTHQSIRIEWEPLCSLTDTPANCYSSDYVVRDGSEDLQYHFLAGTAVNDQFPVGDVDIIATVLRYKPKGGDYVYVWYAPDSTGTATDELSDLLGGTTYEFSVGAVSNYLPHLRDGTLEDVIFSEPLEVTTAAASPPDTPLPVQLQDNGDAWHTRSALYMELAEYGDGYNLNSPNGGIVTRWEIECRPTTTYTWDTDEIKKSETHARDGFSAPTSSAIDGLDPADAQTYGCRARAVSESGTSGWSHNYASQSEDTHNEDSDDYSPLPVRMNAPDAIQVKSDSITLGWEEPRDSDAHAVVGYVIVETSEAIDDINIPDGQLLELEITGLLPYTEYSFTVQAYNKLYQVCDTSDDLGISTASKPTVVTTGLEDDTLGQTSSISLPDLVVTPGMNVAMVTWDGDIDLTSREGEDGWVNIQVAPVQSDTDELEWTDIDTSHTDMWVDGAVLAGWAARPWRYVLDLDANTDYVARFVAQTLPPHPLGTDVRTMTAFGSHKTFTTEAEAQPMPPLPVTRDGTSYVDESVALDIPQNEEGGANVRYIQFNFGDTFGYPTPEEGDTTGSETAGYLIETSSGTESVNPSTTVDTHDADGHWSETLDDETTESTLTSLKGNTAYAFSIRYQDTAGNKGETFDDFVVATSSCNRIDDVGGLELVSDDTVATGAALLTWDEPKTRGAGISGYTILCYEDEEMSGSAVTEDVPYPWTTWFIDNLDANTEYFCKVQAAAEDFDNCSSDPDSDTTLSFTTLRVEPLAPMKMLPPFLLECEADATYDGSSFTIDYAERLSSSIEFQISWPQSTSDDLRGSQDSGFAYNFQFKKETEPESAFRSLDTDNYSVTGLSAGSVYDFRVRAVNDNAIGEWSETFTYPSSDKVFEATAPDYPSSIVIHDQTRAALMVTWMITADGGSEVERVDIECKRGPAVGDSSDTYPYSASHSGVTSGWVLLVDNNIRAPSSVDAEGFGLDEDEDSFVYHCRLRSTNAIGTSEWSSAIGAEAALPTQQGSPLSPSRPDVSGEGVTSNSATIKFVATDDDDGSPAREYTLTATGGDETWEVDVDADEFELFDYEDVDGEGGEGEGMEGEDGNVTPSYVYTFTGLSPSTTYTFTSKAKNRHMFENLEDGTFSGASTASPVLTRTTLSGDRPDIPQPVELKDVLATQFGFRWEMPSDNGSPVEHVELICDEAVRDDETDVELDAELQEPHKGTINAVVCETATECAEEWRMTFAIDGFDASTEDAESVYYCVLVVTNGVGSSLGTEFTRVVMEVEPSDEADDQLPLFQAPTITDVTSTSLVVEWQHPFGNSLTYEVTGRVGDVTSDSVELTGLEPGREYTFTVEVTSGAVTSVIGDYAKTVTGTTSAGPPLAPTAARVEDRNVDAALISWKSGDSQGSEILSYSISCESKDGETTVEDELDIANVGEDSEGRRYGYISELDSEVSFTCGVSAANAEGSSDLSSKTVTVAAFDAEQGTLPLIAYPPVHVDSEDNESDPAEFDDGHITSPSEIKITFGTEALRNDHFSDGLGNVGSIGLVRGYHILWGKLEDESDDADDVDDVDGDAIPDHLEQLMVFAPAGDSVDEGILFYIFTGLQGGTDYQFQVKSFTEDEFSDRHSSADWSSKLIVTTAPFVGQDVPEPPELLDVSSQVLFMYVPHHSGGAPTDGWNEYTVACRVGDSTDPSDASYEVRVTDTSPYVYVKKPVGHEATDWRCKAMVANVDSEGGRLETRWSYDSYVVTLETEEDGKAPLRPRSPVAVSDATTTTTVTVTFAVPPFAGGNVTPYINSMIVYWIAADEYDEATTTAEDMHSEERTLKNWCGDDEECARIVSSGLGNHAGREFELTIEELEGSTEYLVFSRAVSGVATVRQSPLSRWTSVTTTLPDKPSGVTEFVLVDATDSAFLFEWEEPETNGANIESFNIQCATPSFDDEERELYESEYKDLPVVSASALPVQAADQAHENSQRESGSGIVRQYFIAVLGEPGAAYECRIQTLNTQGTNNGFVRSSDSNGVEIRTLELSRSTPLQMLRALDASDDVDPTHEALTLELILGPDSSSYSFFKADFRKAFKASADYREGDYRVLDADTTATVTDLRPNTPYKFRVSATFDDLDAVDVDEAAWSNPSLESETIWTAEGVPEKTTSVTVNLVSEGATTVEELDCDLLEPRFCDPDEGVYATQGNKFKICTVECSAASVFIAVTLITDEADDDFATEIGEASSIETLSAAVGFDVSVDVSVDDVKALSLTNDAAFVDWPDYDDNGSAMVSYTILCSESDEDGEFTFENALTVDDDVAINAGGVLETGGPIGLSPNTTYVCRVDATNEVGTYEADENGFTSEFTTPALGDLRKPSRTVQPWFTDIGSDSLTVNWEPPFSFGGLLEDGSPLEELTGYILNYEISSQTDEPTQVVVEGDVEAYTVSGLKAGQMYTFWVGADNHVEGEVAFSTKVTQALDYATPSQPVPAIVAPLGADKAAVTLFGVDADGIRVDGGLPIDRYSVQIAPAPAEGEDLEAQVSEVDWDIHPSEWDVPLEGVLVYPIEVEVGGAFVDTSREFTLSGLDENSVNGYLVRYAAVNELGVGEYSEAMDFRTEPQAPSAVEDLTVVSDGVDGLIVSFSPPSTNGGSDITFYTIQLDETVGPILSTTSTDFTVADLEESDDGTLSAYYSAEGVVRTVSRGGVYSVTVTATNAVGVSEASPVVVGGVDNGLPYNPIAFTFSSQLMSVDGNTTTWNLEARVILGWHGGSGYERVGLVITPVDEGASVTVVDDTIIDNEVSFQIDGLPEDTEYLVEATIVTPVGEIVLSDTATTGIFDRPAPSAPSTPTVTSTSISVIIAGVNTAPLVTTLVMCFAGLLLLLN